MKIYGVCGLNVGDEHVASAHKTYIIGVALEMFLTTNILVINAIPWSWDRNETEFLLLL